MIARRDLLLGSLACLLPPAAWAQAPAGIDGLVAQVSRQNLRRTVFNLAAFPTRWTEHADFAAVENWVADAFAEGGAPEGQIHRQAFEVPSGKTRHNIVVGDLSDPRPRVIVGAHMDSTSEAPGDAAPGANDNASGVAAMLEAHRLLRALDGERQVIFMAFAGEEQGLYGSATAAREAVAQDWQVHLMLNLDMLGHRPPEPDAPLVIEYDQGHRVADNDAAARAFGEAAARLAAEHTDLATIHTDIWDSDYMPFEAAGYPCIGLYDDSAGSRHYHRSTDTPDRVDYGRLEQATRLTVAILAEAAGLR